MSQSQSSPTPAPSLSEPLLTIQDLAKRLQVTERAVRDWVFRGKLKTITVRCGRLIRFDPLRLEEQIRNGALHG